MTKEIDGCCPAAYICPSSGEVECLTHGGFDCCCADRSCSGYRRLSPWRWLRWVRIRLGYWLRPYDDLADARRWIWQRRQRCGLGALPPEIARAVVHAVERMHEEEPAWNEPGDEPEAYGSPPQPHVDPEEARVAVERWKAGEDRGLWTGGQPQGYA